MRLQEKVFLLVSAGGEGRMEMIWRWKLNTFAGPLPEILKFHTCHPPQEWTWLHYINHIHYLTLSGLSQGLRRLNDATERQEAPRVALGKCQGYRRLAVTSATKQRRERDELKKRTGMSWREWREGYHVFSYCCHQQHREGGSHDHISLNTTDRHSHSDQIIPWYCRLEAH